MTHAEDLADRPQDDDERAVWTSAFGAAYAVERLVGDKKTWPGRLLAERIADAALSEFRAVEVWPRRDRA